MLAFDYTNAEDIDTAPTLSCGEIVDGMTIVGARSRGGFAHIYEAHLPSGRRVALKVLLPHVANMRGSLARMRLEAAALAELDHAHIVEVFGCGEHRGRPYIAMEWLDGRSLADELARRGALAATATLAMFEQICAAVEAAHVRGIVHRDLKAQNIMMLADTSLVTKLVDFGIAKLLRTSGPGITTSMQVVGTPISMAPEQLLGESIDERTDIYALGALLYHCLTGQPAFLGKTLVEIEEMHLSAEPPRVSDIAPELRAVDAVIRRAMAKARTARHPNVGAFLADLRDALGDQRTARRGAAVYVEAECDDDDDFDALDRAMADAEHVLRAAGLEIFAEASNAILAGATLPGAGDELVRRAVTAALAIAQPRMRVRIRAAVDVLAGTSSDLGPRAVTGVRCGVVASAGVLEVTQLAGEPIAETPGMFRVVG
jgi:serine/threonine-protein kinase